MNQSEFPSVIASDGFLIILNVLPFPIFHIYHIIVFNV